MELTKENLIQSLIAGGYLKTLCIIKAFQKVDRRDFMAPEYRDFAYLDEAMPIGYGQTISQPLTVAFMLELLEPQAGEKVLDVGSGSGWTTALLAYIISQPQTNAEHTQTSAENFLYTRVQRKSAFSQRESAGMVFGVEKVPELVEFGKKNLAKYKFKNAEILPAGRNLGLPEEMPPALSRVEGFDKILVSAAAEELPQELVNQLAIGGRMVIPIKNSIWKVDRISKKTTEKKEYFGFSFVPLIHGYI